MASDELRLVSQRFGSAGEMSDRKSNKRRWFSYKSSYNRESSGRSVTHKLGEADRGVKPQP